MSEKYDEYIIEHKNNVFKGFLWLEENLPEVLPSKDANEISGISEYEICKHQCEFAHDKSKYDVEEYYAYDNYFYGGNQSYQVVQDFNKAWLHHIHNNPHHWQHWILINDNPDEGEIILDMPDVYIIEMICDWWAFSWKKGDLHEIFNWYAEHIDYMKLSDYTYKKVKDILNKIHAKLSESDVDGN